MIGLTRARESVMVSSVDEDWQWRSVNHDPTLPNELSDAEGTYQRRRAAVNYFRSAVGGALPDIVVNRVYGAGASYTAKDERVMAVVDRFKADPSNDLDTYLPHYLTELQIYGELFLPIFLTKENADVRLGYLTPDAIESVIFSRFDAKRVIGVVQRRPSTTEPRYLWIVPHPDPAHDNHFPPHPALTPQQEENTRTGIDGYPVMLPTDGNGQVTPEIADLLIQGESEIRVAGYAFYHRTRCLVSGRGHGIYERICGSARGGKNWLRAHEDWFFGMYRNAVRQAAYVWDITVKGITPEQAKQLQAEVYSKDPPPGSSWVHDENTTIEAKSPQLAESGSVRELNTGGLSIIGIGAHIPAHELGGESETNRSTAKEAKSLSVNHAKRFQKEAAAMVCLWLAYQVDQKIYAGQLDDDVDRTVACVMAEMDSRDEGEVATSVKTAAEAMDTATHNNHVLQRDAQTLLYSLMGLDLPPEEVFAQAQAAADAKRLEGIKDQLSGPDGGYNEGMDKPTDRPVPKAREATQPRERPHYKEQFARFAREDRLRCEREGTEHPDVAFLEEDRNAQTP
jgi:hypothetical protein